MAKRTIEEIEVNGTTAFVVNGHIRDTREDAQAYIGKLEEGDRLMRKLNANLRALGIDPDAD